MTDMGCVPCRASCVPHNAGRTIMLDRYTTGAIAFAAAVLVTLSGVAAFDEAKYPDWGGQWKRPRGRRHPVGSDQAFRPRPAGAADAGIPGDCWRRASRTRRSAARAPISHVTCITNGMPRIMTATFPIEFVILPAVTYVHFEAYMPRRNLHRRPSIPDQRRAELSRLLHRQMDRCGRRRPLRHPSRSRPATSRARATYENSGLQLHADNQSILKRAHLARQGEPGPPARRVHRDRPRADPALDHHEELSAATAMCCGSRTIARRTTITWWSARKTISSAPTAS